MGRFCISLKAFILNMHAWLKKSTRVLPQSMLNLQLLRQQYHAVLYTPDLNRHFYNTCSRCCYSCAIAISKTNHNL